MSIGFLLIPLIAAVLLGDALALNDGRSYPVAGRGATAAAELETGAETVAQQKVSYGEALVWYLGHAGWAVRTSSRLLIFDYWEQREVPGERSLDRGRVNPAEIRDLDVFVFVSHSHGDHYDPTIFGWADTIPGITYVFGWDADQGPDYVCMSEPREEHDFDGMLVSTINHDFDGVPEVAYLVKVDGLVIFHSGDHGSTTEVPNQIFTSNIDYFAAKQDQVDLAFISTFGCRGSSVVNNGDLYTIDKLRARAVFPMHHGGEEALNQRFVDDVADEAHPTQLVAALRLGDRFHYSEGRARRVL